MSKLVAVLARVVRAQPLLVLAIVTMLTVGLGAGIPRLTEASGNEGFAPDEPSVTASDVAQERFGSSSAFQIVLRAEEGGEGLVSPAGLSAVGALRAALTEDAGELLPPGQAEQVGALFPDGAEPAGAPVDQALLVAFLDDAALGAGQQAQSAALTRIAEAVEGAPLPDGVVAEPFSFALLFASTDAFASEIGRLFALAGLIILAILAFVFLVWRKGADSRLATLRRAAADVGLAVVVIVLSIVWVNGAAGLLGPTGRASSARSPSRRASCRSC